MIPVTKTYLPPMAEFQERVRQIYETGWLTNSGSLVKELTADLQSYLGVPRIELVANGTLALQLAIKALDLTGEIITTPFTYVATAAAIAWEGCVPVFVDIDEHTFCINPDLIETAITERTSAILATHVYGYPCDVNRIEDIAREHNLRVIYDAAHCFGVKLNGESILRCGEVSAISFHATKLFHTAEGGALVCNDQELSGRISLMKRFGHIGEEGYFETGINAKMSELHAAMGLCVLPKVNEIMRRRREISELYDSCLAGGGLVRPNVPNGIEYNYEYYPIVFASHEQMMAARSALLKESVAPRRYFYPSLNTLPYLGPEHKTACPVSECIASKVLCLPLFVGLPREEVVRVCKIVLQTIGRSLP